VVSFNSKIAAIVIEHNARNAALVELIRQKGGDLASERTIDLHFWAPDEHLARGLVGALNQIGLQDVLANPSTGRDDLWNVEGRLQSSINDVIAIQFVERFAALALKHGATFDGWGTALSECRAPSTDDLSAE
jgi:hypothetical protein